MGPPYRLNKEVIDNCLQSFGVICTGKLRSGLRDLYEPSDLRPMFQKVPGIGWG